MTAMYTDGLYLSVVMIIFTADFRSTDSGFTVNPSNVQELVSLTAEFECHYTLTESDVQVHTTWVINGTPFNRIPSNLCELRSSSSASHNGTVIISNLTITTTSECNNTEVCCTATSIIEPSIPTETDKSKSAVLHVQEIEIERYLIQVFSNGTVLLEWDPIAVTTTIMISTQYDISIVDSVSGSTINQVNNYRMPNSKMSNTQSLPYSYNITYKDIVGQCKTITAYLTPILNQFRGVRTTLIQDLDTVDFVYHGNVILNDIDSLEFTFFLPEPMPFCNYSMTAMDIFRNKTYIVHKTREESGSTDILTFKVWNSESSLPFNRHYQATFSINNTHRVQNVQTPINLSTYDIQNVSTEATKIVISFIHNTTARGAFIVCSINNGTIYNPQYKVVEMKEPDIIEYRIQSEEISTCSSSDINHISVYDIKSDGLLKNDKSKPESEDLRPAVERQSIPCMSQCGGQTATVNSSTSNAVKVTVPQNGHIRFECNINYEEDEDILGCISIIHNSVDYMSLSVKTIPKENPNLTVQISQEMSQTYIYYAVFEWRKSGIIDSNVLKMGMLLSNLSAEDTLNSLQPRQNNMLNQTYTPGLIIVIVILFIKFCIAVIYVVQILIRMLRIKRKISFMHGGDREIST